MSLHGKGTCSKFEKIYITWTFCLSDIDVTESLEKCIRKQFKLADVVWYWARMQEKSFYANQFNKEYSMRLNDDTKQRHASRK